MGIEDNFELLSARKIKDVSAARELLKEEVVGNYIFDDFHKFDADIQQAIADQVKVAADEEREDINIVIVGINECGNRLISFADDVTTRVDFFRMEVNPIEKIRDLISKGETALNISIESKEEIARASGGSFYLAQMLCYEICIKSDILETQKDEVFQVTTSFELVKNGVWRDLSNKFKDRTVKFCKGPKFQSAGRAPYHHLLFWLASQGEWTISIREKVQRETHMRGSVSQVVEKGYLEDHIAKHNDISAVLHFDRDTDRLTLEDPQYAFYIREIPWNQFTDEIGFRNVSFHARYDFALSFSGSSRDVAEKIFEKLSELEFEIFYDRQEEQRLLAVDVEEYLEPIYRSEARFVICILDEQYSKRMWPRIEVTKFEERLGDGAIVPVIVDHHEEGIFSKIEKIGHFRIQRDKLDDGVEKLCNLLIGKLNAENEAAAQEGT